MEGGVIGVLAECRAWFPSSWRIFGLKGRGIAGES